MKFPLEKRKEFCGAPCIFCFPANKNKMNLHEPLPESKLHIKENFGPGKV